MELYLRRIASAFAIKGGLTRVSNSRRRPETSTFMRHVSCASSSRRPGVQDDSLDSALPSPRLASCNLQPRGYLSLGKQISLPPQIGGGETARMSRCMAGLPRRSEARLGAR